MNSGDSVSDDDADKMLMLYSATVLCSIIIHRQGVDISFTVLCVCVCMCLFVCLFVRIRISSPRIKLAASHFARWFIGVQGRESQSQIFVNFAFQKPKIGRICQRAG